MSKSTDPTSEDPFEVALDAEGLKRQSLRGSAVTVVSQSMRMILQFCSQVVLARLLFPADFGLLAMVGPVITFVQVLNDIGLGQVIIQREKLAQEQVSSLFWINLAISSILTLVVAAASPLVSLLYGEPRVTGLMIALGCLIPITTLGIHPGSLLIRKMRFGVIASNEVLSTFSGIVTCIACAWLGLGYWSLAAGQAANSLISVGLSWRACAWRPSRPSFDRSVWSDLNFGGNLTGANLATFAGTSGANIIIGIANGEVALGLYDRSYRLVVHPLFQLLSPISRVAVPLLSRLNNSEVEYREAYLNIIRAMLTLSVPALFVCIHDGYDIIHVFLGTRWIEAAPVFSWLCVGGLTAPLYSSAFWIFVSQDRSRDMLRFMVPASIITVISFAIGVFWGIVGVAAVSAISFACIQTPLVMYGATRAGPVRHGDLMGCVIPFVIAGAVAFTLVLISSFLILPEFHRILASTVMSYGVFLSTLFMLPGGRRYIGDLRRVWGLLTSA